MSVLLFSCLAVILLLIYILSTWKFNYWKKRNVPHLKPIPLLGNYGEFILLRKFAGQVVQEICQAFPKEPYVGAYFGTEPALIVQDPDLIKLITTKDFPYFNGREVTKYIKKEIMTQNMFFSHGDTWKVVRQNMSPLFTASKIRNMFKFVRNCTYQLDNLLDHELKVTSVVNIKDIIGRYTTDCISSCGFGVESNSLAADASNNTFKRIGDVVFENSTSRGLSLIARSIWPAIFYGLRLKAFPVDIGNFFSKLLLEVFKSREYKPSTRNDFVDIVLTLKAKEYITCDSINPMKSEKVTLKVDDELLIAQCAVLFAAGYETSANTVTFTLYELTKNMESQKRVIDEVDHYLRKREGIIDYDCVNELPYLDACINETLRLYPVLGLITREVMENYTLPTGLMLEKGMRIHLPVHHMHHHPDYFPEPERYRPDRFLSEEKHKIKPYTYMPFGEGPRACAGQRIAKMIMVPALLTILKKYKVSAVKETPRSLTIDPRSMANQATTDIFLKLEVHDKWKQREFAE